MERKFKKGDKVKSQKVTILVSSGEGNSRQNFSGIAIESSDEQIKVGEYSDTWVQSSFEKVSELNNVHLKEYLQGGINVCDENLKRIESAILQASLYDVYDTEKINILRRDYEVTKEISKYIYALMHEFNLK